MGVIVDLTGKRYGILTVKEMAPHTQGKAVKWKCLCDCGKTCIVTGNNLKSGHTKSCGCILSQSKRKEENLIGMINNDLTIVEKIPFVKGEHAKWLCRCVCGKEIALSKAEFLRRKSCGCKRSKKIQETKTLDLSGKRFGRLTAISMVSRNDTKRVMWKCLCDCGNTAVVSTGNLRNGHTQSCGCLQKANAYNARFKDYTGFRNGRLTALRMAPHKYGERVSWICKCDCGKETTVSSAKILKTQSCGCYAREKSIAILEKGRTTHGGTYERCYHVWSGMVDRCCHQYSEAYENYGGRGINICDEWLGENGYKNFREWAYQNGYDETAPRGEYTIDRIDVNGNYEPSNCRWISISEQQNNKRNTLLFEIDGEIKPLSEWCNLYSAKYGLVFKRIKSGWNIVRALTEPSRRKPKNMI